MLEKPDVAIIHLGTNDKVVTEELISHPLEKLILSLRAKNPSIKILIVQIPGWKNFKIHFLIYRLSLELSNNNSPINTIPLYAHWDSETDTFDGAHPNLQGQTKIANMILERLDRE